MSSNSQPWPGAVDTTPANGRHEGRMPRWATASATIASFATQRVVGHDDIYVPLATASVAGTMTPAQFTKLAGLEVPLVRLQYAASTDVLNGVALVASTWTDVHAAQNFTVTSATSIVLIELRLSVAFALPATDTQVASAILLDGAARAEAEGDIGKASTYAHAGGHFFWFQGFGAGTHTVKAQVFATTAATAFCRANTTPNVEWAKINVLEITP